MVKMHAEDAKVMKHLSSGTELSNEGVSRMRQIENWAKKEGLNKQQTAGILGNMQQESTGLQIHRTKNWLQEMNRPIYQGDNMNLYMNEFVGIQGRDKFNAFKKATKNSGPKESAALWNHFMEGGSETVKRENYARQYENQINKYDPAHLYNNKKTSTQFNMKSASMTTDSYGNQMVKIQTSHKGKDTSYKISTKNFNKILKSNGYTPLTHNQFDDLSTNHDKFIGKNGEASLKFEADATKHNLNHIKPVATTSKSKTKNTAGKVKSTVSPHKTTHKSNIKKVSETNYENIIKHAGKTHTKPKAKSHVNNVRKTARPTVKSTQNHRGNGLAKASAKAHLKTTRARTVKAPKVNIHRKSQLSLSK